MNGPDLRLRIVPTLSLTVSSVIDDMGSFFAAGKSM